MTLIAGDPRDRGGRAAAPARTGEIAPLPYPYPAPAPVGLRPARRSISPRRAHALAPASCLAAGLLVAAGCGGGDEIPLAQVPADATEKVQKGQARPVEGRSPPAAGPAEPEPALLSPGPAA
jgi:hypothetical protein